MSAVQAVRTTGIYCRPDCSARPSPANVTEYLLPAAAEAAGYRACLRCRPYRSDAPVVLQGPELVCRAVQLVVDGALDDGNEDELAVRIGVSARHLRRLFAEHVGATPDQLARSRRTHFARRLLDDTDLNVSEVAFAAGFGSVRQFNRACLEVFRATPGELRAHRRRSDRLVADGGLDLRLPLPAPLDWPAVARWLAARAIPGVEAVDDTGGNPVYRRTIEVDGDPGVVELGAGEDADHLRLRVHLPHWHGLIHVVQRARRLLALDLDVQTAAAALGEDPLLGELVARRPRWRPIGCWDPFETGVRAIVGQHISVQAATTVSGRIAQRHGRPVPGLEAMGLSHLFPRAQVLAGTTTTATGAGIDGIGLPGARVAALQGFAAAVATGELRLDRSLGLDRLVEQLRTLRGIGAWTANYLALRMGEPDAFPASDLGLRRAAQGLLGGELPRERDLLVLAEAWRPWRAIAAAQLWAAAPSPPT